MTQTPMGVLDLSLVTGLLTQTVSNYWDTAPLWATLSPGSNFTHTISGMTPDEARQSTAGGGCQVTVSLIHIEPSKFNRNFVYAAASGSNSASPRAQLIPALPLALDLYYFVTAWSDANPPTCSIQEQQAISIVLNCFHQNPIIRTNVPFSSPTESTPEEFTLTMEIESVDSISRFWQATTMPFRLSVMYRVAVVFLTPPAPPVLARQVSRFALSVDPATPPFAANGWLFGTSSSATFIDPNSPPGSPQDVNVDYSPATVTPGQRFFLYGSGLNQGNDYSGPPPNSGTSYRAYLKLPPDYQTEQEITAWKVSDSGSPGGAIQTSARMVLEVPASEGSPPLGAPQPGMYGIVVGSDAGPDAITYRTNVTPFSIAALVNVPGSPPLPILPAVAGTYTVTGMGFIAGSTEVMLETVPLNYVSGSPGAGQFTVADIGTITFQAPTGLRSGMYGVRIRVNQVESPPAVWIQI
jgi:Pvc16 N-terminal domain